MHGALTLETGCNGKQKRWKMKENEVMTDETDEDTIQDMIRMP